MSVSFQISDLMQVLHAEHLFCRICPDGGVEISLWQARSASAPGVRQKRRSEHETGVEKRSFDTIQGVLVDCEIPMPLQGT